MEPFAAHVGSWAGTSGFRMMATDPFHEGPATAEISTAAGGALLQVAYTWMHPEDGQHEGLLVAGPGGEPGTATALWGDTFHQHPTPNVLDGTAADGVLTFSCTYAGTWGWVIEIDASTPGVVGLRMHNVVPAEFADDPSEAGPYLVMTGVLHPAALGTAPT